MAAYNYDTLVTRIKNNAEDGWVDDSFLAELPYFIDAAQRRLNKELDTYGFVVYTTITASAGDSFITKPSNLEVPKSLFYVSANGNREPMFLRTDEFIRDYWPIPTSTGVPKYYAHYGSDLFLIAPTPVSTTGLEFSYVASVTALATATSVNWYTNNAPLALFYGAMVEANLFQKNGPGAQVWETRYQLELDKLTNRDRRTRQDDMEVPNSPSGADQPVKKGSN